MNVQVKKYIFATPVKVPWNKQAISSYDVQDPPSHTLLSISAQLGAIMLKDANGTDCVIIPMTMVMQYGSTGQVELPSSLIT